MVLMVMVSILMYGERGPQAVGRYIERRSRSYLIVRCAVSDRVGRAV
jgi:hypothetical protein